MNADPRNSELESEGFEGPEPLSLRSVHRLLRYRYRTLIILACVCAGVGAALGYASEKPVYRSSGVIRITPLMQRILYSAQIEKNSPPFAPAIFEAFVQSQVSIVHSQQVIDMVMATPEWKELGGGQSEQDVAKFWRCFEVTHPPRTELIRISYRHPDPEAAMRTVRLIIDAYKRLYGTQSAEERIVAHRERERELSTKLQGLNEQISIVTSKYGTGDLRQLFNLKMMELSKLESLLRARKIENLLTEVSLEVGKSFEELDAEAMATFDPMLREYLIERQRVETQLEVWERTYTENYPGNNQQLRTKLASLDKAIRERHEKLAELGTEAPIMLQGQLELPPTPRALEALRRGERGIEAIYEKAQAGALEMGRDDLLVQTLSKESTLVQERLEETRGRLEQLEVESSVIGRINVISYGDRPLVPFSNRRRIMAGAGAAAGGGFAFMLVLGFAMQDRRLRDTIDLSAALEVTPVVGITPAIERARPLHHAAVSSCVHELRAVCQIGNEEDHPRTLAVTGSADACGKTSTTVALGASFACTGLRTLLIDFDPNGRGLTAIANSVSNRLPGGLREVLEGRDITECASPTGLTGLFVLPLDDIPTSALHAVSRERFRTVLESARSGFDMVLVDCSTATEGYAVLVACKEAEAVLLTVARDGDRAELRGCLDRFERVGVEVHGAILSRAARNDPCWPQASRRRIEAVAEERRDTALDHLGPLACDIAQMHQEIA